MCGIVGIANHEEASNLTYLGLYALQHRGQEAAGIVSTNASRLFKIRRRSLVHDAFDSSSFEYLRGRSAIGHVRYSTTGQNIQRNVQPFIAHGSFGNMSIAHNGNITNYRSLRKDLEREGAIFQSTMDSEVIVHLTARASGKTLADRIQAGLSKVKGAYSLLFLSEQELIAVRDPMGFRPLILGWLGSAPVVASETCAFDLIGARYEREVKPGEMLIIDYKGRLTSRSFAPAQRRAQCVFEHIYFARPDSCLFGTSVYEVRRRLGQELAREYPLKADVVVPVPDSGVVTAMGLSEESGINMALGLIRNHYVGRTFIEPRQSIRGFGVKIKLNPVRSVLEGKRVIVVDDSIVRGTTSRKIIKMIREAGAKKVYMLISSPPVSGSCYYGIDTPTRKELIATKKSVPEICKHIGADRLCYLSLDGVYRAVGNSREKFCDACFSSNYLTSIDNQNH